MEKRKSTRSSEKSGYSKSAGKDSGDRNSKPSRFAKTDSKEERPRIKRKTSSDESASEKPKRAYTRKNADSGSDEVKYERKSRSFDQNKSSRDSEERPRRSSTSGDRRESSYDRKPRFSDRGENSDRPRRSRDNDEKGGERGYERRSKSFDQSDDRPKRAFKPKDSDDRGGERSYDRKPRFSDRDGDKPKRTFKTTDSGDGGGERSYDRKPRFSDRDGDKPKRSFRSNDSDSRGGERSYDRKPRFSEQDGDKPKRSFRTNDSGEGGGERSYDRKPRFSDRDGDKPKRTFKTKDADERSGDRKPRRFDNENDKPARSFGRKDNDKSEDRDWNKSGYENRLKKKYGIEGEEEKKSDGKRTYKLKNETRSEGSKYNQKKYGATESAKYNKGSQDKGSDFKSKRSGESGQGIPDGQELRLNKFIADSGICSRREADVLISTGAIMINGQIVTELGTKVHSGDEVRYGDQILNREKLRYVLLNKPKDFITTTDDPQNRRTVMDLVEKACRERVYPVGRLDRMTTGLLLFTNDGELAKTLSHPSSNVQKVYQVELDKPLTNNDMQQIFEGITLDDGFIAVDNIAYASETAKSIVGVEIHSGKNRIVRRIFEHLGYEVLRLDRVAFAGLTKKDLPRGSWRHLNEKEINLLRMKRYSY